MKKSKLLLATAIILIASTLLTSCSVLSRTKGFDDIYESKPEATESTAGFDISDKIPELEGFGYYARNDEIAVFRKSTGQGMQYVFCNLKTQKVILTLSKAETTSLAKSPLSL